MAKGQDAARDNDQSPHDNQNRRKDGSVRNRGGAPPNARFAAAEEDEHDDDDEAMIEESFSVGGSEVYDQEVDSQMHAGNNRRGGHDDEDMMGNIDSSGKQKLADIGKSLRQR